MVAPRYSATLEWLCDHAAIARIHEGPGGRYGDPYVWTVVIHRQGDDAHIKGADRPLPHGALRPLCEALGAAGMKRRVHERIEQGRTRRLVKGLGLDG